MYRLVPCMALCALFLITSCTKTTKPADNQNGSTETERKDDQILAEVNGLPIYLSDYRKKFSRSARYNPEKYKEAEARRELLDDLVEFELLYKEARAKKIEETEQIKRMMVRALLRQEVNVTPKVTNEELKAYYDAHPEEFQEIRASHILLKNRPQANPRNTSRLSAQKPRRSSPN